MKLKWKWRGRLRRLIFIYQRKELSEVFQRMSKLCLTYSRLAIVSWCWPSFVMNILLDRLRFYVKVSEKIEIATDEKLLTFFFLSELHVREDVAGTTFMAMATSSPELFINCVGTFVTEGDIGVGTIVGSAVFNVLIVPACCGLLTRTAIQLEWWSITRDCTFYGFSVIALIAVIYDNQIMWYEAAYLVAAYAIYLICKFSLLCGSKKIYFSFLSSLIYDSIILIRRRRHCCCSHAQEQQAVGEGEIVGPKGEAENLSATVSRCVWNCATFHSCRHRKKWQKNCFRVQRTFRQVGWVEQLLSS